MHPKRSLRRTFAPLGAFLAISCLAAFADNPPPAAVPAVPTVSAQQTAYQSSVAQESIRKQTDQVQKEIADLLTEMNVNGLNDPTNLNLLSSAAQHLGSLSSDDMQKVINTLQSASMSTQDQDRQKSMISASQGQKDILLKLKSLAAALSAEESKKEIPTMLQNLIVRQSANIRKTSTLPGNQTVAKLDGKQKVLHDLVSSEQGSIADDIQLVFKILSATPDSTATPANTEAANTSKAVLNAMTNSLLTSTAQMATQLTTAGPFPPAIKKQIAVRTYLIGFLRTAMRATDPVQQLQQAKAQLDQALSDQKDLADAAKQNKQDGAILADRQNKISDDLSLAQAALKSTSPSTSDPLNKAQDAMAKSADALEKATDPSTTASDQQAAADALQKAEDALDQQIASVEKQEDESPADKMAQLQQLQAEVNQAQQNPQASAADLQKLQQDAMVPSPDAADKIADAADSLQQQDQSQQSPSDQNQDQSQQGQNQQGQNQQDQSQQGQNQQGQNQDQSQQDQNQQGQNQQGQNQQDQSQQGQNQQGQNQQGQNQQGQNQQDQSQQGQNQQGQNQQDQSQQGQNQQGQNQQDQSQQGQSQQGQSQSGQQPSGSQNPPDHAQANALLAQASADIQQEEDALKQSAQDYQQLSQASQQLSQAEQETQSADQSMQDSSNHDLTGAAQSISQAQSNLDQMSKSSLPGGALSPDSQQALQQAADALKNASIQAVQAHGAAGAQQGQMAEADMKKAQDSLAQAMAQVQQNMPGHEQQGQGQQFAQGQQNQNGQMQNAIVGGANMTYKGLLKGNGPDAARNSAMVMGGLKPQDRKALAQYQQEKSPPEYAEQVQQYLKNLADSSETH